MTNMNKIFNKYNIENGIQKNIWEFCSYKNEYALVMKELLENSYKGFSKEIVGYDSNNKLLVKTQDWLQIILSETFKNNTAITHFLRYPISSEYFYQVDTNF